jgi:hypothetical protein
MAKNNRPIEGQELAPMEPWRPEYAPQAITSRRHPASTIVAFVLAAGFGLSIGGVFASQAGILPPLGGTDAAVVADPSPDATTDPAINADVDATADADADTAPAIDATPAPTDAPALNPTPSSGPVVIPPPAGGGTDDEDDDGEDGEDGEEGDDD